MFEKGSFVVNASNGICEISDIVTMNMTGTEKEYYVLIPIGEKTAKAFLPVDIAEKKARLVMNKEDAINSHSELEFVLDIQKSDVKRMIEENIW